MTTSDLRGRAHGTDVAKREDGTLQGQIKSMEAQFQLAMPKGTEAAQLVRDALTMLRTTPGLIECTPNSVLGGLMTCAQLGLRPGVLGQAWLVPFYDSRSKTKRATLIIGYTGLIELAHRSGRIASLIARTVYENDTFDVDYGLDDRLIHKPAQNGVERGKPTHYYCIVKFTTGGHAFLVMTHTEMLAYRDRFAMSPNKGPWHDNFEAMAHKTMVRQLARWMPKSTELAVALQVDEGVRVNYDPQYDATEATYRYDVNVDTVTGEITESSEAQEEQPQS